MNPPSGYAGTVFRQCREKYATSTTPASLLAGSLRDGGRFNPPGEFGALYTSRDRETAIEELCRQIVRGGFAIAHYFPRVMLRFDVELMQVYDLTDPPMRQAANVTLDDLIPASDNPDDAGYVVCQEVARHLRGLGFEAIRYPSATRSGENLAVFVDQLRSGSRVKLIRPSETIDRGEVRSLLEKRRQHRPGPRRETRPKR